MAIDVGLRAVLEPELDERKTGDEVRKLEDAMSSAEAIEPDVDTSSMREKIVSELRDIDPLQAARSGTGRAIGRGLGKRLPGKTGTALGSTIGEGIAGSSGGSSGSGKGGGGRHSDELIEIEREDLGVQYEMLESLEALSDDAMSDGLKVNGKPGGGGPLGMLGAGGVGAWLGSNPDKAKGAAESARARMPKTPELKAPKMPEIRARAGKGLSNLKAGATDRLKGLKVGAADELKSLKAGLADDAGRLLKGDGFKLGDEPLKALKGRAFSLGDDLKSLLGGKGFSLGDDVLKGLRGNAFMLGEEVVNSLKGARFALDDAMSRLLKGEKFALPDKMSVKSLQAGKIVQSADKASDGAKASRLSKLKGAGKGVSKWASDSVVGPLAGMGTGIAQPITGPSSYLAGESRNLRDNGGDAETPVQKLIKTLGGGGGGSSQTMMLGGPGGLSGSNDNAAAGSVSQEQLMGPAAGGGDVSVDMTFDNEWNIDMSRLEREKQRAKQEQAKVIDRKFKELERRLRR